MGRCNSGDGERWALLRERLPYFLGLGMSWPEEASNGFRSGAELLPACWSHAKDNNKGKCLLFDTNNTINGVDGSQLLT